jgi:hypothetical protein
VTTASLSTLRRETLASYPYRGEVDERIGEIAAVTGRKDVT